MGFMMPKMPKAPDPPPPPPSAPDFSAAMANRQRNSALSATMGGTFLTAGQKLGTSSSGKSFLGQ